MARSTPHLTHQTQLPLTGDFLLRDQINRLYRPYIIKRVGWIHYLLSLKLLSSDNVKASLAVSHANAHPDASHKSKDVPTTRLLFSYQWLALMNINGNKD